MNINNLCLGCMEEKPQANSMCPFCGFDYTKRNADDQLPMGTILNKSYIVGKCLGEGGFGITYIGFDINLQKKVAIKEFFLANYVNRSQQSNCILSIPDSTGQLFFSEKKRFIDEARILARIDQHPGIVRVINYFEENGTAYIIMEFIEGKSLKAYLKERGGILSVDETLSLMEPVIKALAVIHEKGIVHRDISPDNIMLTNDGKVKLIDFGAAKSKEGNMSANKVYKKSYSPIEQCTREGVIGTYSDIYAVCATIYEMITGLKMPSSIERQRSDTFVSPAAKGVRISPVCDAAIINGLAINPDERIKNAGDLYYFLYLYGRDKNATPDGVRKKIRESSTKVIVDKMKKENIRQKNKRNTWIAVIIITILACGIILVRQIGKMMAEDDKPVVLSSDEDSSVKEALTEEDLESYKQELYTYINSEQEEEGKTKAYINEEYENVSNSCIKEFVITSLETQEEWNEKITTCVTKAMNDQGIQDAGWLVLPYANDFTIKQVYEDMADNITTMSSGSMNLTSCTEIGISVGVHGDGTYFWIIIYK